MTTTGKVQTASRPAAVTQAATSAGAPESQPSPAEAAGTPKGGAIKGIVLVHGTGEAKKGETLYRFVNPIVRYMTVRRGRAPQVASDVHLDSKEQAEASVKYEGEQEWQFREAWWTEAFPKAEYDPALGWTAIRGWEQLKGLIGAMLGEGRVAWRLVLPLAGVYIRLYGRLLAAWVRSRRATATATRGSIGHA